MRRLERLAPPGINLARPRNILTTALIGCCLFSLIVFLSGLSSALHELYDPFTKELVEAAQMWDFPHVLGIAMDGFSLLAIAMLAGVIENYLYFYRESKSIYTMGRIKSPWELHIRCWTLPLISAAAVQVCAVVMTVIYFAFYCWAVPDGLPEPQWHQLIRVFNKTV